MTAASHTHHLREHVPPFGPVWAAACAIACISAGLGVALTELAGVSAALAAGIGAAYLVVAAGAFAAMRRIHAG